MLYLENLNDGYWRNHDEHKQHYIGWIQIFNAAAAINKRKGYNDVRGDICLVSDEREEIVAMAHIDEHMHVKFFTEDDSVSDIKAFGDISPEFNSVR